MKALNHYTVQAKGKKGYHAAVIEAPSAVAASLWYAELIGTKHPVVVTHKNGGVFDLARRNKSAFRISELGKKVKLKKDKNFLADIQMNEFAYCGIISETPYLEKAPLPERVVTATQAKKRHKS